MRGVAAFVLLSVAWAGCSSETGAPAHREGAAEDALASLSFQGAFDVFPDAMEPEDQRGKIRVAWQDGRFAIENEKEWDLATYTVVAEGTAYVSRTGTHWTSWAVEDAVAANRLSNRVLLWDVPALLADPGTALRLEEGGTRLVAAAHWDLGGRGLEAEVVATLDDGRPAEVVVTSPQGRESPFRIVPAAGPLGFPAAVPSQVLAGSEVDAGNAAALSGHQTLADLVASYCRTRAGIVPDSVDPETLRVELLASGASWPAGAYDGQPLRDDGTSGHFTWERTSPTQGLYTGMGWDGPLVLHHFGPAQCGP